MKLKYVNQLNSYELGELYSVFMAQYCGFKVEHLDVIKSIYTITFKGSYYALDDDDNEILLEDSFEVNDYGVLSNAVGFGYVFYLTKFMRKFMFNKFGKPYMEDCFWNDCRG